MTLSDFWTSTRWSYEKDGIVASLEQGSDGEWYYSVHDDTNAALYGRQVATVSGSCDSAAEVERQAKAAIFFLLSLRPVMERYDG